jgi:uncharacterized OB-fold protein
VIALVELDEGPRMLTNIVGVPPEPDYLPLDGRVQVDFEPRGDQVLPVFRMAGPGSPASGQAPDCGEASAPGEAPR